VELGFVWEQRPGQRASIPTAVPGLQAWITYAQFAQQSLA